MIHLILSSRIKWNLLDFKPIFFFIYYHSHTAPRESHFKQNLWATSSIFWLLGLPNLMNNTHATACSLRYPFSCVLFITYQAHIPSITEHILIQTNKFWGEHEEKWKHQTSHITSVCSYSCILHTVLYTIPKVLKT